MPWIVLVVAGLCEVGWAYAMKESHGFTRLWPSVITLVVSCLSFALLGWSMRALPLGTSYTVWTGIGAIGSFLVGILILGEAATPLRLGAAALIVGGLVLMKAADP